MAGPAKLIVNWQHVLEVSSGAASGPSMSTRMARQIAAASGATGTINHPQAGGSWVAGPGRVWAPTPQNSPPNPSDPLHDNRSEGWPPPHYDYGGKRYLFFYWDIVVQISVGGTSSSGWTLWPQQNPPPYTSLVPPGSSHDAAVTITATATYVWNEGSGSGPDAALLDAVDASLVGPSGAPLSPPWNAIYDDFVSAVVPIPGGASVPALTAEANAGELYTDPDPSDPSVIPGPVNVTADTTVGPMPPEPGAAWNLIGPGFQSNQPPSGPPPHPVINFYYWMFLYLARDGAPDVQNGALLPYQTSITVAPQDDLYALAVYASSPPIVWPVLPALNVGVLQTEKRPYLVVAQSDAGLVLVPRGGGGPIGPGDPARVLAVGELLKTAYGVVSGALPGSIAIEVATKGGG
jgi:hypothetical protein